MSSVNFIHHFLIAMPSMGDPNFSRSLTYVCEHNEWGALGIIVNRPIDMTAGMLLERVQIPADPAHKRVSDWPVFFGGPVQTDHGFVLHRPQGQWESTLAVRDKMALTVSRDILHSLGREGQPHDTLLALGYAGWAPGQLEDEISRNGWLTVPAQPDIIFNVPPEQRLNAAMGLLGINPANLVDAVGYA